MFEGALHETCFLAEAGNARTIVVRKHLVAQNRISHLWCVQQVGFEKTRLQIGMLWQVILKSVEQERRCLLHEILAQEYVGDTFHVHKWAVFIRHETRREFSSLLGVHTHNVTQKRCIIRCVAHLLRIQHDLVKLARLGEAGHNLVGDIRAQVHT